MSQQDKVASLRSQLFAQKGLARPASGFRVTAREDEADDGADVRPATAGPIPVRAPVDAGEPEPAAALRPGGFDKADIEHVALSVATHAGPRLAEVAASPDPDAGTSDTPAGEEVQGPEAPASETPARETEPSEPALWWRAVLQDIRREVLVGVGLLVLVVAGLGLGYLIGTVTRGTPDAAPAVAAGSEAAEDSETALASSVPPETEAPSTNASAPEAGQSAGAAAPETSDGDPVAATTETDVAATSNGAVSKAAVAEDGAVQPESARADASPADAPAKSPSRPEPVEDGTANAPAQASGAAETASADATGIAPGATVPRPDVKPAASAASAAAYTVQLGSLSSAADARRLWDGITADHGALFAGLSLDVRRAVVDGRTFYRARTGAFADVSRARGFCDSLQARGLDCLVVRR